MTETAAPVPARHPLLGLLVAQFLGAFNDNAFKMVVLLLALAKVAKGDEAADQHIAPQALYERLARHAHPLDLLRHDRIGSEQAWVEVGVRAESLKVLKEYRGAAKSVVPDLKKIADESPKEKAAIMEVVGIIESDTNPPQMISLKEHLKKQPPVGQSR